MPPKRPDPTLSSPRILCLHGGGVTGEAFRLQARALVAKLQPTFRLVFADGPFLCDAGPGILPVFADFAPFRRWLRWLPEHKEVDADTAAEEIHYQLTQAMEEDNRAGATGEWVGLLGFSQGSKVSASLLYEQQVRASARAKDGTEQSATGPLSMSVNWRFAILLAGRAPLVSLSPESSGCKALVDAAEISEGFATVDADVWNSYEKLKLPTVHVHGLLDPGLHLHRRLLNQYCEPGSTTLVEWEGEHRVPIKTADVDVIVKAVFDVAKQTGAIE